MKTRYKSLILLLSTLIVGMVLGALIHGAVMGHRIKRSALRLGRGEGMWRRFEQYIELQPEQKEAMKKVFEKHRAKMDSQRDQFMALIDSLEKELEPILTEEQKKKLADSPLFRKDRFRGPPFGPPKGKDRQWRRGEGRSHRRDSTRAERSHREEKDAQQRD